LALEMKHCDYVLALKPLDRETIPSLVVGPHRFVLILLPVYCMLMELQ